MRITRVQFVIACLLIFAVAVVFIAPSVDLDPTTLGSQQAATMAMAALVAAGTGLLTLFIPHWTANQRWSSEPATFHGGGLLDLICTRLC